MNDAPLGQPTVAHLLEHLVFAGANESLVDELGNNGASVTAYTHLDATLFQISGHIDLLPTALSFVANVFAGDPFTMNEFVREIGVMRSELTDAAPGELHRRNRGYRQFWGKIGRTRNWKVSPLKEQRMLGKHSREATLAFRAQYYVPSNAALALVSPLAPKDLLDLAEATMPSAIMTEAVEARDLDPLSTMKPVFWWYDAAPTVWMHLVYSTDNVSPLVRLVAQIVAYEMGGGMHSAMIKRFRRDDGVAYNARTDPYCMLGQTMLATFISIGSRRLLEAVEWVAERLNAFTREGMDQELVNRHTIRLRRQLDTEIERPEEKASYLAYEGLRTPADRMLWLDEYVRLLEHTSLPELRAAAGELLQRGRRNCFLGGNVTPFGVWRAKRLLRQD